MYKILMLLITVTAFSCNPTKKPVGPSKGITEIIPSLGEMASIWAKCDTIAFLPSIRNFRAQAIANRDMTSISWFNSPPYSGGYHTGTMKLDDITIDLSLDVIAFLGKYETNWQWWYPLPSVRGNKKEDWEKDFLLPFKENLFELKKVRDSIGLIAKNPHWPSGQDILNTKLYETNVENGVVTTSDNNSVAKASFAFVQLPEKVLLSKSGATAFWKLTIPAGESKKLSYVMSYGDDTAMTTRIATNWVDSFDATFASVRTKWEQK